MKKTVFDDLEDIDNRENPRHLYDVLDSTDEITELDSDFINTYLREHGFYENE